MLIFQLLALVGVFVLDRKKRKTSISRKRKKQNKVNTSKEILSVNDVWERTFDSIPDLIAVLDNEHRIVRANKSMAERLGVTPEQCIGLNCFKCVHKLDSPPSFCPHALTLADGKEHTAEVHEDNLGGDFLVSTAPLFDQQSKIVGSVHVARDITQRKKAEEEIKSLSRFPAESPNVVMRISKDGNMLYSNKAGLTILDEWKSQVGQPVPMIWRQLIADVFQSGSKKEFEEEHGTRTFLIMLSPIVDAGYVNVYGREITERKKAEQALQESEERFRAIAETSLVQISVSRSSDGVILFTNPAYNQTFGFDKGELIGVQAPNLYVDPADRKTLMETLMRQGFVRDYEVRVKRKDSAPFWIAASVASIRFGGERALLGVSIDITERKEAEEALRKAHEELEARVQERTKELREASEGLQAEITERKQAEEAVKAERKHFIDVLEKLPAYLVLLTPDYHVFYSNRFFRERFGEDHGRRCFEYLFGRTEPCEPCETYKTLKTMAPLEWEWTGPDGHNYYIYDSPFTDIDGSTLIMEVGIDITERKKAEEQVTEQLHMLELAPVIVIGLNSEVIFWNKGAEGIYGLTEEQTKGKIAYELLQTQFPEPLDEIKSKLFRTGEWQGELTHRKADGTTITVKSHWLLHRDKNNNPSTIIEVNNDITERKKAEEALRKANEQLKEENSERMHTEQSLRLEEARLDALLHLSQISEAPISEITSFTLEQAVKLTHSKIGFVGFLNKDETIYTIHTASKNVVKECNVIGNPMEWPVSDAGLWANAIRERKTLFVNDYNEPLSNKKGLPPGHVPLERVMVVPFFEGERIVAVAGVGNKTSDYDKSDERQVFLLLNGMWSCVQKNRSREELQKAYNELEVRVEERTRELREAGWRLQAEITEHKRTEEDLCQTRDYLESLIDYANAPITVWNPAYQITRFNHAFERLTGHKGTDVIGKRLEILFPNESKEESMRHIDRASKGEYWQTVEIPIIRTDGNVRTVLWNSANIRGKDGTTVVGTIAQGEDITERKQAEKSLRESQVDMNRAQAVAQTGSWRLDVRNNALLWSDETYSMFGIPKGTPLTYETFLNSVHPDDRKYVDQQWQAAMRGEPYDIEHRILVNGRVRWVREKAELELNKDGALLSGFGTVQDVTEKREMHAKLEEYSKHLEELVEEKTQKLKEAERLVTIGETAGMVGHDIRNPLQSIEGAVYLAREELKNLPDSSPEKKELYEILEIIKHQSNYIDQIVADLQDFSRTPMPQLKETNLHELIIEALSTTEIPENIQIQTLIQDDLRAVTVDPVFMKRVFLNLIENAAHAMPKGGKLTIKAFDEDQCTFIHVEDTGVGISEEDKTKIFSPLFTTKAKGQGFGLAACKKLVEAHKGEITFESEAGKGTVFKIKLPHRKEVN
jgi:PAS domain S-box-containing protein